LWGELLVVVSIMATAAHLVSSSAMMFTTIEHLVSASGTVAIASKIGGAVFASVSVFGLSVVAWKMG
jgi:hypothetical protein